VRDVANNDAGKMFVDKLRDLLVCPACHGRLVWSELRLDCAGCSHSYEVRDGIPLLIGNPYASAHDEIDHSAEEAQKRNQAMYFDRQASEDFEITRPHGAPRLYGWLLWEKFRLSLLGVNENLGGLTALAVCGGSGMDAEFLIRSGASVITCDISFGAACRVAKRARRYGFKVLSIVGDAERLPLGDRSVDLVYVHDGLHHLIDPVVGLREMARVASRYVSVSEPYQAAITSVAVHLGLAKEFEDGGNRVSRLRFSAAHRELAEWGFGPSAMRRYIMYYRHKPGSIFRVLSAPGVFWVACQLWTVANALLGRFGNKVAIVAVRSKQD
jgi:SAM-dependent methyltransferase/uncharacterized protein YbaR (Trm112 family)